MNKFQNVAFDSVNDFLEYLPEHERVVTEALRRLVTDCIPDCREKLAYNVPFYYRHSRICFIWPASVPWGNTPMKGVQLGFCNGNLLQDEAGYLDKGNRKQVYSKIFYRLEDIDYDLLRLYLFEATDIDNRLKQQAKPKR